MKQGFGRVVWWISLLSSYYLSAEAFPPPVASSSPPRAPRGASPDDEDPYLPLWKLASAHCASQALHTVIQLEIPQLLHRQPGASLEEISQHLGPSSQKEALLRLLRLLTTVDILREENRDGVRFFLTPTGQLLVGSDRESSGMAAGIQHWMEGPLWDSWLEVPQYLKEGPPLPFERANDGISSDYYYNPQDHPQSLQIANQFVRWVHQQEIQAILQGFDWTTLRHKQLVDIGGHYGTVLKAIFQQHPSIDCTSLDLPEVVEAAPASTAGVKLMGGNVLDASTLPQKCDAIMLKHFLDRCMWSDEETVQILYNCRSALAVGGRVIVAEAVLPDISKSSQLHHPTALHMDALYMLVGREGQRTEAEWRDLATKAGFQVQEITTTCIPTCSILVLVPEGE